jgi:hypothetical protein
MMMRMTMTTLKTISAVVALGTLSSVALFSCAETDCHGGVACNGPTADGGGGGGDGPSDALPDVPVPPGCDAAADPKDAPKCVVSEFGVFADATAGADTNPGTKDAPVKTLAAALSKLAGKARVYVCEGTYPEHLALSTPVSLYAGFACASWSYTGAKAKVAPADAGYALEVKGASGPVILADLDVTAKDADAPGESSVAAFVLNSTNVTLRRVTLTAGNGMDGTDGTTAADFAPTNAPDGTAGAAGGAATPNPSCLSSIGGAGGKDGTTNGAAGVVAVNPVYPTGNNGAGGTAGPTCGIPAADGSYGLAGAAGAGAATPGTLDANGWKGTDGTPGGAGGNGQGGGGGAQRVAGGVGGSGGPGGCGGAGGARGTAAGSSVALLVFQSPLALENTALRANDAGRGGNAANGQKAQLGNLTNASPSSVATACAGGAGGVGGSGGGGGGGAGGLSAGILYKGTAPTVDGASTSAADTLPSVTLGKKGAAGTKGLGGDAAQPTAPVSHAGLDGADGAPGDAKAVMSIQ